MGTDTGVTWCDASVNDDDTEYIRADLVAAMLAEARAQEREACAAIADARDTGDMTREDMEARRIAAAIRARGDET